MVPPFTSTEGTQTDKLLEEQTWKHEFEWKAFDRVCSDPIV